MCLLHIMNHTWVKIAGSLFTYGFAREMRAEYPTDHDVLGTRMVWSFCNGCQYMVPPFTMIKMAEAINRIDICLTNKDKILYKQYYREVMGYNWNVIL
jgi:hypothetical protein